ncbi:hypothetical protein RvY_12130 [Ramazzottius varieornatus]|uniref:Uncharacterized protein n=1 Tax=Ramazzottius varieornatus TaxID=947166 RepID=A0A1D1VMP5_RAMVA|nr:hypothetical protein RvY_12130 [Ramazzottius varieornatus]
MDYLRERNNQSLIRYSHTNIFQPNDRAGDCASVADDSQYLISRWYYTRGMSRSTATDIFLWPSKHRLLSA